MPTNPKILETAARLQEQLEEALADNERLVSKTSLLQQQIADLESRARIADERAAAAEKKRATLQVLAADEYKNVVKDLFSGPSQQAARHTSKWAIASIVVSLLAALWSVWYSSRSSSIAESHLTTAIENRLTSHIQAANKQTAIDLSASERRLNDSLREITQSLGALSVAPIVDLPRNISIWRALPVGQDMYFKIAIPPNTQRVDIRLRTITGNADLYFRYGEPPTPSMPASPQVCGSTHPGAAVDACYAQPAAAGDWFIRVHGKGEEHSYFTLQATY